MAERLSELVVRSLTIRGWKERTAQPGEEITVDSRPLRIAKMQLVSGYPEGQSPPPPREHICITSHFQQGEQTALQVTKTSEGGETHTKLFPIIVMPDIKRRRGIPTAIKEFARHGVIAEYVTVRMK